MPRSSQAWTKICAIIIAYKLASIIERNLIAVIKILHLKKIEKKKIQNLLDEYQNILPADQKI